MFFLHCLLNVMHVLLPRGVVGVELSIDQPINRAFTFSPFPWNFIDKCKLGKSGQPLLIVMTCIYCSRTCRLSGQYLYIPWSLLYFTFNKASSVVQNLSAFQYTCLFYALNVFPFFTRLLSPFLRVDRQTPRRQSVDGRTEDLRRSALPAGESHLHRPSC